MILLFASSGFSAVAPIITVGPTWTDNGDGTATVTFTTDIDCYGGIDYGTSTGIYTSSAFDYSTYPTLEFGTSHTVPVPDVGAGGTLADGTYYYRVWAGTPEGFNGYISDEETGTIASIQEIDMLFWGIGSNAVNAGATDYSLPGSQTTNATEAIRQLPINRAMTLKNFAVGIRTAQPGTGSLVCTVRKNGAATALTVTFAAGAAASVVIDSVNEVAFAAGDLLSVQLVNNASAGSGAITGWTIETVDA